MHLRKLKSSKGAAPNQASVWRVKTEWTVKTRKCGVVVFLSLGGLGRGFGRDIAQLPFCVGYVAVNM